ncbi:MAG: hypothetical protein F4Z75_02170 [Synechococcus sp. SB0668_bin_15]|nr:hypothetical protein [Synechococcus sp. SB0668_bin_15]MXZ82898.1 hypothetical protein [Synechococcus sp. SB0666_bin_14]MYC49807.1 hypothetical protein [Synechococcus sp. SB0662_bin_14]MYG45879.1 hypothetical protein [Synechococcus sp. SB0675_bin_6]MYJ59544.1 hypothetical protein [Synechococcus sp. SB0672_bin_6]
MTLADPVSKSDAQTPPPQAEGEGSRFSVPRTPWGGQVRPLIQIETALLVAMFAIGATGYFRVSARMDGLNTRIDGLSARMDGLSARMDARLDRLDAKIDASTKELRDLILSQGR